LEHNSTDEDGVRAGKVAPFSLEGQKGPSKRGTKRAGKKDTMGCRPGVHSENTDHTGREKKTGGVNGKKN